MARRKTQCSAGHEVTAENRVRSGPGWRCAICERRRLAKIFAGHCHIDPVRVTYYLIPGRPLPKDGVEPSYMELLVAAAVLRPGNRRGGAAESERPLHEVLGVSARHLATARTWAAKHNVEVPSLAEVHRRWYEGLL